MLSLVISTIIYGCQGNHNLWKSVTAHSCPRWAAAIHVSLGLQCRLWLWAELMTAALVAFRQ